MRQCFSDSQTHTHRAAYGLADPTQPSNPRRHRDVRIRRPGACRAKLVLLASRSVLDLQDEALEGSLGDPLGSRRLADPPASFGSESGLPCGSAVSGGSADGAFVTSSILRETPVSEASQVLGAHRAKVPMGHTHCACLFLDRLAGSRPAHRAPRASSGSSRHMLRAAALVPLRTCC